MLIELIYTSRSTKRMTVERVSAIADEAQRLNSRDLVTGYLSCHADSVLQLLEGREDLVRATFARIQHDPRHTDIRLIHCGPIYQRRFQQWSMHATLVDLPWTARLLGFVGVGPATDLAPRRYQSVRTAEEAHRLISLSLKFEGQGTQPPSGPADGGGSVREVMGYGVATATAVTGEAATSRRLAGADMRPSRMGGITEHAAAGLV